MQAESSKARKLRRAWDEPGHAHFLTYSCYQRWPLLTKDRTRHWVIEAIEQTRRTLNVAVRGYVIMPEHVHVVVLPRELSDSGGEADIEVAPVRRILACLKRSVSARARDYLTRAGQAHWLDRLTVRYPSRTVFRFWQPGGGYDHNIWRDKSLMQVIEYIHANPVRRGLVDHPTNWYWSSARFWDGAEDVPLRMDAVDS